MDKNTTEIIFILDRSGSMEEMTEETIGGFNSLIKKHKKEDGEIFITTVLFDNKYELLHDHVNIKEVKEMTTSDYYARGSTALLDAIGKTIDSVSERLSVKAAAKENILFVITTDGYENSSTMYSKKKIKKMIEDRKKKNDWKFLFLGADIDAASEAGALGISQKAALKTSRNKSGIKRQYDVISSVAGMMMACPQRSFESICEDAFMATNED